MTNLDPFYSTLLLHIELESGLANTELAALLLLPRVLRSDEGGHGRVLQ